MGIRSLPRGPSDCCSYRQQGRAERGRPGGHVAYGYQFAVRALRWIYAALTRRRDGRLFFPFLYPLSRHQGGHHLVRASLTFAWLWMVACTTDSGIGPSYDGGPTCVTSADCADADVNAGRCVPQEKVCENGACAAHCRPTCQLVDPTFNPCREGLICNQSNNRPADGPMPPYCTALPTRCATNEDCPLYLLPDAGPDAAWWCESEVCRYGH